MRPQLLAIFVSFFVLFGTDLRANQQKLKVEAASVSGDSTIAARIKLSPQIRFLSKIAQSRLSWQAIAPSFVELSEQRLVSKQQLGNLPYVLGGPQNIKNAVSGQLLYVEGWLDPEQRYGIYQQGKPYQDPQSGKFLGYQLILLAEAKVLPSSTETQLQISRIEVQHSRREVKQGDLLLALPEQADAADYVQLKAPDFQVSGLIMDSRSGWREFAQGEIVLLNRGLDLQLEPGHLLAIYRASPEVIDSSAQPAYPEDSDKVQLVIHGLAGAVKKMPNELVGQLMVVQVAEHSSYAMILHTGQSVRVGDLIGNL